MTNKAKIRAMMHEDGLTVEEVIDVVIEENGIIGVGLVSLAAHLNKYVTDKIK